MKNLSKLELSAFLGSARLPGFLSSTPTAGGILRRFVASIDARGCIVVAALVGLVALFIPWLTLDGQNAPLSGVGLMSYALQGNDRIVMWEISPVATALLLSVPFGIAIGVGCTAWNELRRTYRADVPCLTLVAILVLLRFVAPLLGRTDAHPENPRSGTDHSAAGGDHHQYRSVAPALEPAGSTMTLPIFRSDH